MRNKINPDGSKVFEYNYGPRFHDLSVVLNGADRTAKALQIYDVQSIPVINKAASVLTPAPSSFVDCINKAASAVVTPVTNNIPLFSRDDITFSKLAGFKKEVTDKLYVISLLNRMEENGTLTDEDIEEILHIGKEAGIPLHLSLEKYARRGTLGKDIRNIAIGTTGIAGLTNYFQGKRLRGEYTSGIENFVADNPGVLPVLFALAGYPVYKKFKVAAGKYNPLKKKAFSYTDIFTKEAEEFLAVPMVVDASDY